MRRRGKNEGETGRDQFQKQGGGTGGREQAAGRGKRPASSAVRIHQGVIAVIARHAALQAPGVAEMSGSFADGWPISLVKPTAACAWK